MLLRQEEEEPQGAPGCWAAFLAAVSGQTLWDVGTHLQIEGQRQWPT